MSQTLAESPLVLPGGRGLKAVFYDVGGTLLETVPTLEDFSHRLSQALGTRVDADRLKASFPDLFGFITEHESQREGRGTAWRSDTTVKQLWVDFYVHSFQKAGVEASLGRLREVASAAYDWYLDPLVWRPFPDVVPTFSAVREAGLKQGVISDWGSDLLGILTHLGLTEYLDFVVSSAVVGWAKPHPEIFLHALARAGVEPGDALYVGDFYVNDILGARSVGIHPVLIDREGTAPPVDCSVISTLAEIAVAVAAR